MSKFNNPDILRPAPALAGEPAAGLMAPEPVSAPAPISFLAAPVPESEGAVQRLGFVVLAVYILSGYANDFSIRLFHTKAYLSTITVVLLPLILLMSGAALRGLRVREGKLWLFFFLWMVIDLPFSAWRSGTASLLINYGPRSWILLYYIVSFVVTITMLRRMIYVQVFGAVLLLLSCIAFGSAGPQRFDVQGSLFFSNANELAMSILFGMAVLMFPIMRGSALWKIAAVLCLGVSTVYLLKTGSRGGLLGFIAMFLALMILSRRRLLVLLFMALGAILAVLFVSHESLHRLSLAFGGPSIYEASGDDFSAIASRMQRTELLRRSIILAIENPLFGVGPGQFAVAVDQQAKQEGKRSPWLGTHNSYTEVASECGIPALICYCALLWFCIRTNYRLFRTTQDRPGAEDVHAITFCLLLSSVVYAVCTFFDHVAYTGILPTIGGLSIALKLATDALPGLRPAARAVTIA